MSNSIHIDASRALHPEPTGIEVYSREIIAALLALPESAKYDWHLLAPNLPNPTDPLIKLPGYAQWQIIPGRHAWTIYHLSQYFRQSDKSKSRLFVPAHVLPIVTPEYTVLTIHDLAYRYFPENYGRLGAWRMNREIKRSIAKANTIICPSQATADDIVKFYEISSKKIVVVPHGIDHQTLTKSTTSNVQVPERAYFLSIGRIEPRKNTLRLAEAYNAAWQKNADLPELYHIGRLGYHGELISEHIKQLPAAKAGKIKLLGYQSQADTIAWRQGAIAFLFPSLYEGFGIPILEAMADGVPTLTSTSSCLPEAAGGAALLVDPEDINEIAHGISELATNQTLRSILITKGRARVRDFTWQAAAQKTLTAILNSPK